MIAAAHFNGTDLYIHMDSGNDLLGETEEVVNALESVPDLYEEHEQHLPIREKTSGFAIFGWNSHKEVRRDFHPKVPRDKGHEKNWHRK